MLDFVQGLATFIFERQHTLVQVRGMLLRCIEVSRIRRPTPSVVVVEQVFLAWHRENGEVLIDEVEAPSVEPILMRDGQIGRSVGARHDEPDVVMVACK